MVTGKYCITKSATLYIKSIFLITQTAVAKGYWVKHVFHSCHLLIHFPNCAMVSYSLLLRVSATFVQIFPLYNALQSAEMKVIVHGSMSSIMACQECVLDGLGATRMDLKSNPEEVPTNLVTYTITGSEFVFTNLASDCWSTQICDIMVLTLPSSERETAITPYNSIRTFDWNNVKLKCVLTLRQTLSILFMACIQESATARFVGRFRFTTKWGSYRTLFVIYDPKSKFTADACKRVFPDTGTIFLVGDDLCKKLMSKLPFAQSELPSSSDSNEHLSSIKSKAESGSSSHSRMNVAMRANGKNRYLQNDVRKLMKDIDAALDHPIQCLQPEKSFVEEYLAPCHGCLARIFGPPVIAAVKQQTYNFFVFSLLKSKRYLEGCRSACGAIQVLGMMDPTCRLYFHDHFITFPLGDQFLAPISRVKPRNLFSVPPQLSSGCVWANGTFLESNCLSCLENIQYSSVHELSDSTALVLLHSFDGFIEEERKVKLASCVYFFECLSLFFVPNYICTFEKDLDIVTSMKNSYTIDPQPARDANRLANSLTQSTSKSNVSTHALRLSDGSHFREANTHNELLKDHRNPFPQTSLFDEPQRTFSEASFPLILGLSWSDVNGLTHTHDDAPMRQETTTAPAGVNFSAVAPSQHGSVTVDGLAIHVFVVHWMGQSESCAECLALYGEVILFSTRRRYAWMIKGTNPVDILPCVDCGILTTESVVSLNIYSLRPISSARIKRIMATRIKEDNDGDGSVPTDLGSEATPSPRRRKIMGNSMKEASKTAKEKKKRSRRNASPSGPSDDVP